ncbi:MAG: hypothetical protein ABIR13_02055 [Polaromonas sp.]
MDNHVHKPQKPRQYWLGGGCHKIHHIVCKVQIRPSCCQRKMIFKGIFSFFSSNLKMAWNLSFCPRFVWASLWITMFTSRQNHVLLGFQDGAAKLINRQSTAVHCRRWSVVAIFPIPERSHA